jgi:hypothetical protein
VYVAIWLFSLFPSKHGGQDIMTAFTMTDQNTAEFDVSGGVALQ